MTRSASFEATVEGAGDLPDIDVPIESISNATLRHSALSNVDIDTAAVSDDIRRYADFFAAVELRVSLTGGDGRDLGTERIYRGRLVEVETSGSSAVTTLKTVGRLIKLDKTDGFREFADIRAFEALRQYIDEETEFDVDVADDPGTTVVDDGVALDIPTNESFSDVFEGAIPDDKPIDVVDDKLTPTEIGAVVDATDDFNASSVSRDDFVGGVGAEFRDVFEESEITIDIGYSTDSLTFYARGEDLSGDDEFYIFAINDGDGNELTQIGSMPNDLGWTEVNISGEFGPGEHTFVLTNADELEDDSSGEAEVDVIAVLDSDFDNEFPNELDEPAGNLDGPSPLPNKVAVDWPIIDQETQVTDARIFSDWDDTGGPQQLAASPNAGEEYVTVNNSETLDADFREANILGTDLRIRTTHGRHSPDGPRDDTPRLNYAAQSIESLELRFDQSSVAIIGPSGILFAESDLQNIKDLASLARYNFVVDHSAEDDRIEAFPIGTEIDRDVEWFATDWDRRDGDQDYANRVVARGATKPEDEREAEDDLRYEAAVSDKDEIQRLVEIGLSEAEATQTTVVTDPELKSTDEVQAQAFNTLEDVVANRLPSGRVRIVPTFLPPGYAYPVDEFETTDGEVPSKVLEKLTYREAHGSDATGELEFETPRNWVSGLSPVESDVIGIKRLF